MSDEARKFWAKNVRPGTTFGEFRRAPTLWQRFYDWVCRRNRCAAKCEHEFDYLRHMTERDEQGFVSCKCSKCLEVFYADCGLNLPGKLIQTPGSMQAMHEKYAARKADRAAANGAGGQNG